MNGLVIFNVHEWFRLDLVISLFLTVQNVVTHQGMESQKDFWQFWVCASFRTPLPMNGCGDIEQLWGYRTTTKPSAVTAFPSKWSIVLLKSLFLWVVKAEEGGDEWRWFFSVLAIRSLHKMGKNSESSNHFALAGKREQLFITQIAGAWNLGPLQDFCLQEAAEASSFPSQTNTL